VGKVSRRLYRNQINFKRLGKETQKSGDSKAEQKAGNWFEKNTFGVKIKLVEHWT